MLSPVEQHIRYQEIKNKNSIDYDKKEQEIGGIDMTIEAGK